MSTGSVFVSYSRKDFYFAESLVYHLRQRGVGVWFDATDLQPGNDWAKDIQVALANAAFVVLIASPHSERSEYVRGEWGQARADGKRIIVARFRGKLSAELANGETVDFRGSFMSGLDRLITRLDAAARNEPPELPSRGNRTPLPPLPAWVTAIGATLAALVLSWFLLAEWDAAPSTPEDAWLDPIVGLLMPAFAAFLVWHFSVSFLARRMGMTRLVVSLAVLAISFSLPLLSHFGGESIRWLVGNEPDSRRDRWHVAAPMLALALVALGIVIVRRPEDLLRWCPTGKVWTRYRLGRASDSAAAADVRTRISRIKRFHLLHESQDAPAAARFRQELLALGAIETSQDDAERTSVILLTNRTRTRWLEEQSVRAGAAILPVAATAITLPEALRWLWRRQWIDFRRWNIEQTDAERGLPQVPEAVTQVRLPAPVNRVHHVLCALTALLFSIGGALMPPENAPASQVDWRESLGILLCCASLSWAVSAWRLVRRRLRDETFFRLVQWTALLTIVPAVWALVITNQGGWEILRLLPAAVFLAAAPLWILRQRVPLQFWFPLPSPKTPKEATLASPRSWETVLWAFGYAFLWMPLLGYAT